MASNESFASDVVSENEQAYSEIAKQVPIRRAGTPEAIALSRQLESKAVPNEAFLPE